MAGIKGRSGHIGQIGMDPQSPIRINCGSYRAEKAEGKGKDLYFDSQDDMLDEIQDKADRYTPMIWDTKKSQYVIDWDSAELLGM